MDNEIILRLEREISEASSSSKQAHKRIDELQKITEAFHKLATNVEIMVTEMKYMKNDITEIKSNIEEYHHKEPNKFIFNVKNTIITGIVSALVGALIALVFK